MSPDEIYLASFPFGGSAGMKLRPVLLVVLLLSGFYYLTTHVWSTGAVSPWLHRAVPSAPVTATRAAAVTGPMGNFEQNGLSDVIMFAYSTLCPQASLYNEVIEVCR